MAEVYKADTVKLYAQGSLDGQACDNVSYWYAGESPASYADLTELMSKYVVWMRTYLLPYMSNTYRLVGIKTQVMSGPDGLQGYLIGTEDDVGSLDQAPLPNSIAACMSLVTGRGGRSAHGRQYWGGFVESQTNQNRWTPSHVLTLNAAGQALLSDMDTGTFPFKMVVYSRYQNKVKRTVAQTYDVISVSLRDDVVDSQRRRLPGRGR